jgi:RNA polymerase sigma-70 factor (ECF subfamily)
MSRGEMPLASPTLSVEPAFESSPELAEEAAPRPVGEASARSWTFDSMYQSHASFVWRNAHRLGVPSSAVEDVMQEVFLVVHRRLAEFEERTSVKAWLSAILIRVVRAQRRTLRRKHVASAQGWSATDPDGLADARAPSPLESAERDDAVRELYAILSRMNEDRREVLVLSELEELTAPEIALALQVNINTVYWRLRAARKEFERILFRRRAADGAAPR